MRLQIPDTTRTCISCAFCTQTNSGRYRCEAKLNPALDVATAGEVDQILQMALLCDRYMWAPSRFPRYREMVISKFRRNAQFSTARLPAKFVPYYESQTKRIKVKYGPEGYQHTVCGRVSISTGHSPVFLLMRNARANASTVVLDSDVKIVGERLIDARRYYFVEDPTC